MAILDILHYPDPRLRKRAAPVTEFGPELRRLAEDMLETMYAAPGIGLAATQVNVHRRLVVVDVSATHDEPQVLVNPQVVASADDTVETEEGCLSVPGVYDAVTRPAAIRVRAQDLEGAAREFDAEGLLAVCIQHEIDHLEGKLFVDYLSSIKRARIRKRLDKAQRVL